MDVLLQTVILCKKEACYPPIRLYFTNLGDGGKSPICPSHKSARNNQRRGGWHPSNEPFTFITAFILGDRE